VRCSPVHNITDMAMVLPSRRDSGEGASDGLNKSGVGRGWSCYSGVSNMVAAGWA
jgi:hypothetical protein